jgi:hypothetical protein
MVNLTEKRTCGDGLLKFTRVFCRLLLGLYFPYVSAADQTIDEAIRVIEQVGPGATGSESARRACDQLAHAEAQTLPRLLIALDTPNIVAANWFRIAFDQIADRELAMPNPQLPQAELEQYLRDSTRHGRARRLTLTLLQRVDPTLRNRLLPDWLDDPEFGRDAVNYVLSQGDREKEERRTDPARRHYENGFRHARESDQVLQAVDRLKSVGQDMDAVAHMGFVNRWWLVGPFPAPETTGFHAKFPPEKSVDLAAEYDAGDRAKLRWKLHQSTNPLGEVNLIQAIGPASEAVGYAFAEIDSAHEQSVQLRCSADDNISVWLNERQVLAREQWLNGTRLDRFVTPVTLQQGLNRILVKICQGPPHTNPEAPNSWKFQLRFCDETGGAAPFRNGLPLAKTE